MEEIKLEVQIRNAVGSSEVKKIRMEDFVPGIVYGGKSKPTMIKIDSRTFERIRRQHHGEVVFHLNVLEGEKKLKDYSAIVREEQHDPVNDSIVHVDFKRISLMEEIEVKATISAKGEPIGVKRDGGSLEHNIWELTVVCLPKDIPEEIPVDVSGMQVGDNIHVKDIILPPGVRIKQDPEAIVLSLVHAMKEEEEKPEEGAEGPEPEVIKEKKPNADEEGGSSEAPAAKE